MQRWNPISLCIILLLGFSLSFSCKPIAQCKTENINGYIESVHFAKNISIQEEIPIYVQVQNQQGLCIESTSANITANGIDTFLITATVNTYKSGEPCPCLEPQFFASAVMFKSERPGNFVFIYNKIDGSTTSGSDVFQINVQ